MGAFLSQIWRWAKVWAICGAILMLIVAAHSAAWSPSDPGELALNLMLIALLGAVIGAVFGSLAGLVYAIATAVDSGAGARVPLGIIAGGISGFLSMRIIRVRAISAQEAPIEALVLGAIMGYFIAKSAQPVRKVGQR